jgi:hypothetical protein
METCPRSLLSRVFIALSIVSAIALTAACGDDEENANPKASCDSMCKGAGFTTSNLDQQANETNCFCQGGNGTVSEAACTDMCKAVGKPGKPFGPSGPTKTACQCQ